MSSSEKVPYPKEYRGDDPPSRKRERINENQVRQEGFQFKLTALAIAILLLLTPLASYIPELKEEEEDVSPVPIENMIWLLESELQQEAYYAAVEVLTNPVSSELTINLQEDRIRSKLIFLVETDLKTTFGDEHGLTIDVNDMNVYLSIVPVLTGSNQVVPGYYELQVDYRIETGTNGDLIGYQQKSTKIRITVQYFE